MNDRQITTVGMSDGIYNEKIRITSKSKVALRAFKKNNEHIVGGIFIREEAEMNNRMNKYEITSIGSEAKEVCGLEVGDIVYADALARYYDTFPVSVIRYDSIIFKQDKEDENKIYPLNGMCFVKPDKPIEENKHGIIVLTDLLPTGKIVSINANGLKKCDIKIGDVVLLTNKCDCITFKGNKFYIYKIKDIDALIEE